ncbi:MAG: hypothetical protein WEE66_06385 [Actinomycetota bacterium]
MTTDRLEIRPEELQTVDEYRRTARDIFEAAIEGRLPPSGSSGWPVAVVKLGRLVHREAEPVRGWAGAAVWQELRLLWGDNPEAGYRQAPPPSYVFPLRRLSAEGHETCPGCRRPIPTPAEFRGWDLLELDAAKRRDVREKAINR